MSHQSVLARLDQKNASCPATSQSPVQSISGICIKQEYFEDKHFVTVKTESESPSQQHNIMQSIKVEVKKEEEVHYDEQDCRECVVKRELDYDEQLDTERPVKRQQSEQINGGDANDGQVNEKIKVIHLNCTEQNCQVKSSSLDQLHNHLFTGHGLFHLRCFAQNCTVRCDNRGQMAAHIRTQHFGLPRSVKEQIDKKIEDDRDPNEYVRVVKEGDE